MMAGEVRPQQHAAFLQPLCCFRHFCYGHLLQTLPSTAVFCMLQLFQCVESSALAVARLVLHCDPPSLL